MNSEEKDILIRLLKEDKITQEEFKKLYDMASTIFVTQDQNFQPENPCPYTGPSPYIPSPYIYCGDANNNTGSKEGLNRTWTS